MPRKRSHATRRRGAQPGNVNAVRHGIYSRRLPVGDRRLAATSPIDLAPEIELLRTYCQELLDASANLATIRESLQAAHTVALLTSTINRLTRTQYLLATLSASGEQALSQPPSGAQRRGETASVPLVEGSGGSPQ